MQTYFYVMIRSFSKKSTLILVIFSSLLIVSCGDDKCRTTLYEAAVPVPVTIERLDQQLFKCKSEEEILTVLQNNPIFANDFLQANRYPDISLLTKQLYGLFHDPHFDTLRQEVDSAFGDLEMVAEELGTAFANIQKNYPDFKIPKVKTIITGLENGSDLFISDEVIIIGLDFFVGPGATFKPNPKEIPSYMLERYTRDYLTAHIINYIGLRYIQSNPRDNTMLAEMIDYGKSYFFTSQMLPCMPLGYIVGYNEKVHQDVQNNEKIIWTSFLNNEVLYETNHVIKNKFNSERPKVFEIGNDCPGRVGRWIGYRILESYAEAHEGTSLREMMEEEDAKTLFLNSKYNPLR